MLLGSTEDADAITNANHDLLAREVKADSVVGNEEIDDGRYFDDHDHNDEDDHDHAGLT